MRYLVTGATGFIGTHLCRALVARGDHVTALVRNPRKAEGLPAEVATLTGDLTLFADPTATLPMVDVVVHLAGVVAAPTPEVYEQINYDAVVDLVACLERQVWKPKRMLFASSLAAAGPSTRDRPHTERDTLAPIDPYGEAKARAERVVSAASFPTTSFRPCIVFGPGDPATLTLFKSAQRGVGMRVGSEPQRLSVVDVRDVVAAILAMSDDSRPGHWTYYVSHSAVTDLDLVWAEVGNAVGKRVRVLRVPAAVLRAVVPIATIGAKILGITNQMDMKQYKQVTAPAFVCSSAALTEDLGWRAAYALPEALRNAVAGYRASGLLSG